MDLSVIITQYITNKLLQDFSTEPVKELGEKQSAALTFAKSFSDRKVQQEVKCCDVEEVAGKGFTEVDDEGFRGTWINEDGSPIYFDGTFDRKAVEKGLDPNVQVRVY